MARKQPLFTGAKHGGKIFMSNFSVELNSKRPCRYVFKACLWDTNVTNNWKLTISCVENRLDVTEQFSDVALQREYPYRYCYDNKGRIMALSEFMMQI
jgi:hypothetical protein